jgi:hypothetical protein
MDVRQAKGVPRPMQAKGSFKGQILTFGEGASVDTGGELRIITLSDGMYVTGEGHFIPVASREEGEKIISQLKQRSK